MFFRAGATLNNHLKVSCVCSSLLAVGLAGSAIAQTASGLENENPAQIEEIVVTAQKREQSLRDVPLSVQLVSGDFIRRQGMSDVEELAVFLPNVQVEQGALNNPLIRIRGVGTGGINIGFEESAAVFNDGLYYGRPVMLISGIFDLERVEILYGPQPVYFGQSAIAGLIAYHSKEPSEDFGGYALLEAGEQGQRKIEAAVGGGLGDGWAARVAGRFQENDGWTKVFSTGSDGNASEDRALRLSVSGELTGQSRIRLKTEHWQQDAFGGPTANVICDGSVSGGAICDEAEALGLASYGYAPIINRGSLISAHTLAPPEPPPRAWTAVDSTNIPVTALDAIGNDAEGSNNLLQYQYDFGGRYLLTSLTGFSEYDVKTAGDFDQTPFSRLTFLNDESYEQFSTEIRLESTASENLTWMAGLYWQSQDIDFLTTSLFAVGNPRTPSNVSHSTYLEDASYFGAFGAITWEINNRWALDLGLRYSDVRKDGTVEEFAGEFLDAGGNAIQITGPERAPDGVQAFGFSGPIVDASFRCVGSSLHGDCIGPLTLSEDDVNGQIALRFNITDKLNLWARYANGFKPGGFSRGAAAFQAPAFGIYAAEEADTYEIGGRFVSPDRRLSLNATLYQTEYTDQQVTSLVIDPVTERPNFVFANAAKTTVRGIELDTTYQLGGFSLFAAVATMNGKFDSYPNNTCTRPERNDAIINPVSGPTGPGLTGQTGAAGCMLLNPNGSSGVIDVSGMDFEGQPDWTAHVRAAYRWHLTSRLQAQITINAAFYDDYEDTRPIPQAYREQGAYSVINVTAGLASTDGRWDVSIFGRNITDELYWQRQPRDISVLGTAEANISRSAYWGVQAQYHFGSR
jgi:outer membrane receptor protein involved in Fe transport